MDFDVGDLSSLTPTGSGDGGGERFRGSPPPLGCIVISVVILLGIGALAWWTMKG